MIHSMRTGKVTIWWLCFIDDDDVPVSEAVLPFRSESWKIIIYAFNLDSAGDFVWDTVDLKEKTRDTPPNKGQTETRHITLRALYLGALRLVITGIRYL